jgi:hypothetical protein
VSTIRALAPDVLIVAGDIATGPTSFLQTALALRPCAAHVLFLAGNHDVWSHPEAVAMGVDAWAKLDRLIPALCKEAGVHYLESSPVVIDGVGFVGTLGWYDHSMRDTSLDAPEEAYVTGRWAGMQWMDPIYAVFRDETGGRLAPEAVAAILRERLVQQLTTINADKLVACTHHVQFASQLLRRASPGWQFCQSFIGHAALGAAILGDPRVVLSVCGHTHHGSDQILARPEGPPLRAVVSPLGYLGEWGGEPTERIVPRRVALAEV